MDACVVLSEQPGMPGFFLGWLGMPTPPDLCTIAFMIQCAAAAACTISIMLAVSVSSRTSGAANAWPLRRVFCVSGSTSCCICRLLDRSQAFPA